MEETRSPEQIREHYDIEKVLADKLRRASKQDRRRLYTEVYDELFRRIPHHPQLEMKTSPQDRMQVVDRKLRLLGRYLRPELRVMELGPGDCALSLKVAGMVKHVSAVDVSPTIMSGINKPENLELFISDGASVPVPKNTIDIAFSDQLMEHLHPEDAREQLEQVYRAIAPGGSYICVTPNRLAGPHDVSQHFDDEATGLHLLEYTVRDLVKLFRQAGFQKLQLYAGGKGIYMRFPIWGAKVVEALVSALPGRRKIATLLPVRAILGVNLVGTKTEPS